MRWLILILEGLARVMAFCAVLYAAGLIIAFLLWLAGAFA